MHKRAYDRLIDRFPGIETAISYLLAPDGGVSRRAIRDTSVRQGDLDVDSLHYMPTEEARFERASFDDWGKIPERCAVSHITNSVIVVEWADGSQTTTRDLNRVVDDEIDHEGGMLAELFLEQGDVRYVVLCTLQKESLVDLEVEGHPYVVETRRSLDVEVLAPRISPDELTALARELLPVEAEQLERGKATIGDCLDPNVRAALYAMTGSHG